MTYATRTDLEERYGADELTQRESVLPAGAVDRALGDADAEVDGYLASGYVVPLNPVPANVVRLAAAIARYRLLGDAQTEAARKDYEDAIRYLRTIQAGAKLDGAAPLPGSAPAATIGVTNSRDKVFGGGIP